MFFLTIPPGMVKHVPSPNSQISRILHMEHLKEAIGDSLESGAVLRDPSEERFTAGTPPQLRRG